MVKYNSAKLDDNMDSSNDEVNYLESESEFEPKEVEDSNDANGYSSPLLVFLVSYKGISCAFATALGISSFFINFEVSLPELIPLSSILQFYSISIYLIITIELVIDSLSSYQLRKSCSSFYFYLNELSCHISGFIVLLSHCIFIYLQYPKLELTINDHLRCNIMLAYRLALLSLVTLGILKSTSRLISMRFNYNMYLRNVQKNILRDIILNMCKDLVSEHTMAIEGANKKQYNFKNGFILRKKFLDGPLSLLSFEDKRLLIKEFNTLVPEYSGTVFIAHDIIKRKSRMQTYKILNKMNSQVYNITDIQRFFPDYESYSSVLNILNIKEDQRLDRSFLKQLLEKYYRDLLMTSRSLSQVNAALERIYLGIRILVYFVAIFSVVILSNGEMSVAAGIISTILGTQVVSKILSDNVLQSIIFLFIIHPFDIGDRIFINIGGVIENLIVAELNVFSTSFFKWDGTFFFIPNTVLINTPISNMRRSRNIMENHIIQVSSKTSPEKLVKLKENLKEFCLSKSEFYTDYVLVNYEKIEDSNKLFIKVLMQYQGNFQHHEAYLHKRSIFVGELNSKLNELKIRYKLPVQKVKMLGGKRMKDKCRDSLVVDTSDINKSN